MIRWSEYNKIADDVFSSANLLLKMNVSLAQMVPSQDGTKRRRLFHTEFGYKDSEGTDTYSIHRVFDYYLSIENTTKLDNGYKEFIRIGPTEIDMFRRELAKTYRWIYDNSDIYTMDDNGFLFINTKDIRPVFIGGLPPRNKFISFEPAVSGTDTQYKAMKIIFNSQSNLILMSMSRFMGFYHAIMNINLFNAAQNMINYMGRPAFGSNLFKPE